MYFLIMVEHKLKDIRNYTVNRENNPAVYRNGVLVFGDDTNNCLITAFLNKFPKTSQTCL